MTYREFFWKLTWNLIDWVCMWKKMPEEFMDFPLFNKTKEQQLLYDNYFKNEM